MTTRRLLIDTNAIMHLSRAQDVGRWLLSHVPELNNMGTCLTCRVIHGEIWAFEARARAKEKPWSSRRITRLTELMDRIATIELSDPGVVAAYAEIVAFTEIRCKPARPMTKNDLWIAAAARIAKASILTSDKDFDHLQPMGVQVVAYDTNTIRTKQT